jgi:hypothetical protein
LNLIWSGRCRFILQALAIRLRSGRDHQVLGEVHRLRGPADAAKSCSYHFRLIGHG